MGGSLKHLGSVIYEKLFCNREGERQKPRTTEDVKKSQEEELRLLKLSIEMLTEENRIKISKLLPVMRKIDSFEKDLIKLSDVQLKAKTNEFKARFKNGETLNDLLPEAFAVVREAFLRLSGKRIYSVQMLGGIIIHQKKAAEIKTGEGKTFVAMLPAYLRVLSGQKVHIITHNQYLSTRDFKKTESLYQFLGVAVNLRIDSRKRKILSKIYEVEILFTTIESGFDLMDGIIPPSLLRNAFAIIDEADYSLIDLNNNSLVLVRKKGVDREHFKIIKKIFAKMKPEVHYKIESKSRVLLTEAGKIFIQEFLERFNYSWMKEHESTNELLIQTYLAVGMRYQKGIDYLIYGGQVIPIDEFTGRLKKGHRFGLFVHQLLELREGIGVRGDEHVSTLPLPVLFDLYQEKGGMTGTIDFPVPRKELSIIYGISDVVVIPTKYPSRRIDLPPRVFLDEQKRDLSLVRRIEELRAQGNPVLLITQSVNESESLERLLKERKLPCEILNAENEREENKIIHRAGGRGKITISTNMSGRGTDIIISEQVAEKGGLVVLVTFRSEISPRLDYQGMGRAARQGQPGSTQFFLYLDPSLYSFKEGDFRMHAQGDIDLERHPDVLVLIDNQQRLAEEAISKNHLTQYMLDYSFYLQERFKQTFENLIMDFCYHYYSQNDRSYSGVDSWDVRDSLQSAWNNFFYIRQLCLANLDTQIYTKEGYEEFNDVMYKILKEKLFEAKHIKKILGKNKKLDEKLQEAWKEMTEQFVKTESRILKDIELPDKPPDKIRLEYRYKEVSSPLCLIRVSTQGDLKLSSRGQLEVDMAVKNRCCLLDLFFGKIYSTAADSIERGFSDLSGEKRNFSSCFLYEPSLDEGVIGEMPAMGEFLNYVYIPLFKVNDDGLMFWPGKFDIGNLAHLIKELSAVMGIPEFGFFSFRLEFRYLLHILTSLFIIETTFRFSHISSSNNSCYSPALISNDKEKITPAVASPIGGIFVFSQPHYKGLIKTSFFCFLGDDFVPSNMLYVYIIPLIFFEEHLFSPVALRSLFSFKNIPSLLYPVNIDYINTPLFSSEDKNGGSPLEKNYSIPSPPFKPSLLSSSSINKGENFLHKLYVKSAKLIKTITKGMLNPHISVPIIISSVSFILFLFERTNILFLTAAIFAFIYFILYLEKISNAKWALLENVYPPSGYEEVMKLYVNKIIAALVALNKKYKQGGEGEGFYKGTRDNSEGFKKDHDAGQGITPPSLPGINIYEDELKLTDRDKFFPPSNHSGSPILGKARLNSNAVLEKVKTISSPLSSFSSLPGTSSSLDEEVSFFDDLGRISFKAKIKPERIDFIKRGLENILEAMPKNIIADLKLNISAGGAELKVVYEDALSQSSLLKKYNGICLNIGKDVLSKISDNFDLLLLWDVLSEGIASLMLSDYDELKYASRTNENAYFKIELIKALLNYKAYLVIYHKALHRQSWSPKNYWDRKTTGQRQKLKDKYLRELDWLTQEVSGIYQGDIFFNVMDDDDPMFMIIKYIHILSKNPLFNEDVIYDIISKIRRLEVLNKVSLARVRNVFKEFFFNGMIRLPAPDNTFEERYFFSHFDDTPYVSGLKDILLTTKDRNVFYPGLRRFIRYFLPLPEKDLDGEIEALFEKDDNKLFSPGREEAVKRAIGEIFIRRLDENTLSRVMKFLSGDRSLAFVPYMDILPITLNKGDDADNDESLRSLPMRDIDYNFIPGQENRGNIDWVSRLFLFLPKTDAADDGHINAASPLFEERDASDSGSSPIDYNEPIDEVGIESDSANNPMIPAFHRPDYPSLCKADTQKRYYNLLHKALSSLLEGGYITYENIEALSHDFYQRNHILYIYGHFLLQEKKGKFVLPEGVRLMVFIPYYFGFIRPEDLEAWCRRGVVIFIKASDEIIEELKGYRAEFERKLRERIDEDNVLIEGMKIKSLYLSEESLDRLFLLVDQRVQEAYDLLYSYVYILAKTYLWRDYKIRNSDVKDQVLVSVMDMLDRKIKKGNLIQDGEAKVNKVILNDIKSRIKDAKRNYIIRKFGARGLNKENYRPDIGVRITSLAPVEEEYGDPLDSLPAKEEDLEDDYGESVYQHNVLRTIKNYLAEKSMKPDRERSIIYARLGIDERTGEFGKSPLPINETSKIFGVSKSRIFQITSKLRDYVQSERVKESNSLPEPSKRQNRNKDSGQLFDSEGEAGSPLEAGRSLEKGKRGATVALYDGKTARAARKAGGEIFLVGDSLLMVLYKHKSTRELSADEAMEIMLKHTRMVSGGAGDNNTAEIIGDMPYGSYNTVEAALTNAKKFIEAGATAVKIEGGRDVTPIGKVLTEAGIRWYGHIGYEPQKNDLKAYGIDVAEQMELFFDALSLQEAGARAIVLEMVYAEIAAAITGLLKKPTIGIGSGPDTDYQILVIKDILGTTDFQGKKKPCFAVSFRQEVEDPESPEVIAEVFGRFQGAIKSGAYPQENNYHRLPESFARWERKRQLKELLGDLEKSASITWAEAGRVFDLAVELGLRDSVEFFKRIRLLLARKYIQGGGNVGERLSEIDKALMRIVSETELSRYYNIVRAIISALPHQGLDLSAIIKESEHLHWLVGDNSLAQDIRGKAHTCLTPAVYKEVQDYTMFLAGQKEFPGRLPRPNDIQAKSLVRNYFKPTQPDAQGKEIYTAVKLLQKYLADLYGEEGQRYTVSRLEY